jgi:hypothetical protein
MSTTMMEMSAMMSVLTKSGWTARARRIAFGGAFGLAVVAAFLPAGAQAQDDEEDNKTTFWNFDKKLMRDFMRGIGLRDGTENQIEYRERSPLVIPPSRNLPPPEQAGAGRTEAWPTDPDVKRRKAAAAKRKEQNYNPEQTDRNLTPSELNPPGVGRSTGPANTSTSMGDDGKPVLPSELGYFGGLFSSFGGKKEEQATFTTEPPRNSLTAPPTGYQTPSAAQPYGLTAKQKPTVTPYDRAVGGTSNPGPGY